MHTLSLSGLFYPKLAPYIHAFPNLKNLTINTMHTGEHYDEERPLDFEDCADCRATNQSEQVQFGAWDRLDKVDGNLMDLYLMGLSCPVQVVRLFVDEGSPWELLTVVLDDMRISELSLVILEGAVFNGEDGLLPTLRRLTRSSWKTLRITISLCSGHSLTDLHLFLVSALMSLLSCLFRLLNHSRSYTGRTASCTEIRLRLQGTFVQLDLPLLLQIRRHRPSRTVARETRPRCLRSRDPLCNSILQGSSIRD